MPERAATASLRRYSHTLLDGIARAPARSYLRNIGYSQQDLRQPVVGVARSWTGTSPCNVNHRYLADQARQAIRSSGGTPMGFATIAVADRIVMGTAGMRTSLVSREVIADSIELMARAHHFAARSRSRRPACATTGALARYALVVGSASEGAVLAGTNAEASNGY